MTPEEADDPIPPETPGAAVEQLFNLAVDYYYTFDPTTYKLVPKPTTSTKGGMLELSKELQRIMATNEFNQMKNQWFNLEDFVLTVTKTEGGVTTTTTLGTYDSRELMLIDAKAWLGDQFAVGNRVNVSLGFYSRITDAINGTVTVAPLN